MTRSHTSEEDRSNMASYAEKADPNSTTSPKAVENKDSISSAKPVFILESDVFGFIDNPLKPLYLQNDEMYEAVGKVINSRFIKGLQRIRGLWRIYVDDTLQRDALLTSGLHIRGRLITIYDRNPRVTKHENSTNIRIRVKDVPLSADDGQILRALEEYQCTIVNHFRERLRYQNMLTNCQTGDRIFICQGPSLTEDIPRTIPIGKYRATIIYRGQPNPNAKVKCTKCLSEGHRSANCPNGWRCKGCGAFGHKQSECTDGMFSQSDENSTEEIDTDLDDQTQTPISFNQTVCDTDSESHQATSADDFDHSQSILSESTQGSDKPTGKNTSQGGARQKVKPQVNKIGTDTTNGQKQITNYVSRKNINMTPNRPPGGSRPEKSPITPTEELHEKERNKTKKQKNND